MPHLSELQRAHKDQNVTIIGLTSEDANNSLEQVKAMVKEKGDVMDYTVAWDVGRKTNEAYMKASGQRGIPTSFLVDKAGKIAWIGHPGRVDMPLAMVLDGSWDYVKGPAMIEKINEARNAVYEATSSDPERALTLLAAFKKDYPMAAEGLEGLHFAILVQLPDHAAEAAKVGRQIVDEAVAAKNGMALNQFAWSLVDPQETLPNRFLDLALVAAQKANEFSGDKDPAVLDTLARVYYWKGDLEKAVEIQRRAVENAEGRMKASLEPVVEEYEAALREKRSA